MPFLIIPLGTVKPVDGQMINVTATYSEEYPRDTYGNALIVTCEFFDDDRPNGPRARLA